MRIAIARPDQVGPSWLSLGTGNLSPHHIRQMIKYLLDTEERVFEATPSSEFEFCIVTLNRTILDMVGSSEHQLIPYENVWVWDEKSLSLRPLLEVKDLDWLAHFALGDLLDRNDFESLD